MSGVGGYGRRPILLAGERNAKTLWPGSTRKVARRPGTREANILGRTSFGRRILRPAYFMSGGVSQDS